MTNSNPDPDEEAQQPATNAVTRRTLLAATGAAAVGAAGYATGHAAAQTTPSGTFPIDSEDPLLKLRADRIRLVPRTSDPSSPDNGTMWYRGDL